MANTPKVYVICDANCKWEGMTKEQILTAITQAVSTGEIKDIDTGFIQTIKTINGLPLKFFVGEQAEYEALTEEDKKDLFAVITNDKTKDGIITTLENLLEDYTQLKESLLRGDFKTEDAENAENAKRLVDCIDNAKTIEITRSATVSTNNYKYLAAFETDADGNETGKIKKTHKDHFIAKVAEKAYKADNATNATSAEKATQIVDCIDNAKTIEITRSGMVTADNYKYLAAFETDADGNETGKIKRAYKDHFIAKVAEKAYKADNATNATSATRAVTAHLIESKELRELTYNVEEGLFYFCFDIRFYNTTSLLSGAVLFIEKKRKYKTYIGESGGYHFFFEIFLDDDGVLTWEIIQKTLTFEDAEEQDKNQIYTKEAYCFKIM